MLRPQDNETRETKRLDGLWEFAPDPDGTGRAEGWWRGPLPDPRPMPVPSSFDDVTVDPAVRRLIGEAWYQRTVHVPTGWDGRRIIVRFDAATHRAAVWADDTLVAEHEGGYTPFEAD
ncbi:MAG: beta-glucuronidase, partial [Actinobacteria bacterium]|nr:beta-glucuronidase [Actinomycetota bacterium]